MPLLEALPEQAFEQRANAFLGNRQKPLPDDASDTHADWEVALEAPVNRVLPVARAHIKRLWAAFGEA